MDKKPDRIHPDRWLGDLPNQSQNEGFKPEEMIGCPECDRRNPPNRLKCFYCNAELPVTDEKFLKPDLRKPEDWEKGFNVFLQPKNSAGDEIDLLPIAKFLNFDIEDLQKILDAKKTLPLVRVESEREAEIISRRLNELNLETFILNDESLKPEKLVRRLRGIEFWDGKLILILFSADQVLEISPEDLGLIVSGLLYERKIESVEKHNRKKENKILETREISADETIVDIYSRSDGIGYRIEAKGFDFSCLEADKKLLVNENIKTLIEKIREFAPEAKFDDDYRKVRWQLSRVWEIEQSKDTGAFQNKGFGRINLESVVTLNNSAQFTKYSRLQWHLL